MLLGVPYGEEIPFLGMEPIQKNKELRNRSTVSQGHHLSTWIDPCLKVVFLELFRHMRQ